MVTLPVASVTQKVVGVDQGLLTDSEVLAGMLVAVVYWTRRMSAWQICTFIFPAPRLNVTLLASTVYAVLVGAGAEQVNVPPVPLPPAPPVAPPPAPPVARP